MTTHTTTDLPFAELPEAEQRARAQAIQDAERDRYWAAKRAAAERRETARTARAMGGKITGGKRRLPAPNRADLRAQGVRNTRPRRLTAATSPLVDTDGTLGRLTHRALRGPASLPVDVTFRTVLTPRGAL